MRMRMFDERQDVDDFLALYEISFEKRMSKDYFTWKYVGNPFRIDRIPIIVAEHGNRLVGARSCVATRMMIGGKIVSALQPCDTMVHPEFKGRGVFTQMNEFAIKEFQGTDYKIFYNFPNKKSFRGNLKCGWQTINKIGWYWQMLDPEKVVNTVFDKYAFRKVGGILSAVFWHKLRLPEFREQNITIESVNDLNVLERIFYEWERAGNDRICTVRDKTYLNWRFRAHPEKEYLFIVAQVGTGSRGYFVLNTERFMSMNRGTISDYLVTGDNPNIFESLLTYSLNLFQKRNCDVVDTWVFTQRWAEEIVKKHGFMSSQSIFIKRWFSNEYLVARPIDRESFSHHLSHMEWYITPSDADFF